MVGRPLAESVLGLFNLVPSFPKHPLEDAPEMLI